MRRLLLTIILVLLVPGCGNAPEPDAASIAEDASAAMESSSTLRFTARAEETRQPIDCEGAVDYERRRVQMACDLGDDDWELVSIGTDQYMRGSLFTRPEDRDVAGPWEKTSGGEEATVDIPKPRELLRGLRRGAISSERLGREQVRGVETTRYRVVVNAKKAQLEESVGRGTTVTLELWIDDDELLRRMSGNEEGGPFIVEFFAFGEPVEIEPPPANEVHEGPRIEPPPGCVGGETAPFSQVQVAEALRRNGFTVESDPSACVGEADAIVGLSNVVAAEDDELERGFVTCRLRRGHDGDARVAIREDQPGYVVLELANVSCTLYATDSEDPAETRLADLRKAFAELGRSLR